MANHLHHAHIFASDIKASVRFYEHFFNGKVMLDMDLAGARNVFMRIGTGRLHFYDQPAKQPGRSNVHHLGIQTHNIEAVVEQMKSEGIVFRKGVTDFGFWKYIMVPAPDDILIELFQVDKSSVPAELVEYFEFE